jgi:NhaP-type Na+/H+ or K+/H+ antiporter
MSAYHIIIFLSVIIILSYVYNILARKTNIPSVLMLIATGVVIKKLLVFFEMDINVFPYLELLGNIGLILIVLEAALDLKLSRQKLPIIWKSAALAIGGLVLGIFFFAYILQHYIFESFRMSILYATPLAIISSAIVIPSVGNLANNKKEFLIYESTFSDIIGIIFFYFIIDALSAPSLKELTIQTSITQLLTIVVSLGISYLLIYVFQRVKTDVRLFLLIAVLLLLYAVGKLFHLSSLIIILIFGIILNNREIFFWGKLRSWVDLKSVKRGYEDLHLITNESAFVIRTFFFVVFGMNISLGSLIDFDVFFISLIILLLMYSKRLLMSFALFGKDIYPKVLIAPRGLITILLFYSIPAEFKSDLFDPGILLYVVLITGFVMSFALMTSKSKNKEEDTIAPSEEMTQKQE